MIEIDDSLLKIQRRHLNQVITEAKVSKAQIEALEGIQNLLDAISDSMLLRKTVLIARHTPTVIVNQKKK